MVPVRIVTRMMSRRWLDNAIRCGPWMVLGAPSQPMPKVIDFLHQSRFKSFYLPFSSSSSSSRDGPVDSSGGRVGRDLPKEPRAPSRRTAAPKRVEEEKSATKQGMDRESALGGKKSPFYVPRSASLNKELLLEFMADERVDMELVERVPAEELQRMATVHTMLKSNPFELLENLVLPLSRALKDGEQEDVPIPPEVIDTFRRETPPDVAHVLEPLDNRAIWDSEAAGSPRSGEELPASVFDPELIAEWEAVDQRTTGPDELRRTQKTPLAQRSASQKRMTGPLASMTVPIVERRRSSCPICALGDGKSRRRDRARSRRQVEWYAQKLTEVLELQSSIVTASHQDSANTSALNEQQQTKGESLSNAERSDPAEWMSLVASAAWDEARQASHRRLVDFRDVALLLRFIGESGRILPRRRTKCCALHQRQVAHAIKCARQAALISPISRMGYNLVGHPIPTTQ